MRFDRFTIKAQEALQAAKNIADENTNQALEPLHLLEALLEQQDGIVIPVLQKLGVQPEHVI